MAKLKEISSIKRVGPRYGRTTRAKVGRIEKLQRSLHKCPYCNNIKVKRIAAGIWQCKKCSSKFANKAYYVSKVKTTKEVLQETAEETKQEEVQEEKEEFQKYRDDHNEAEETVEEVETTVEEVEEEPEEVSEEETKEE